MCFPSAAFSSQRGHSTGPHVIRYGVRAGDGVFVVEYLFTPTLSLSLTAYHACTPPFSPDLCRRQSKRRRQHDANALCTRPAASTSVE